MSRASHTGSDARRAAPARRALLRATELVLLTSGLALLGIYAAARLDTAVAQAAALEAFAVAQAAGAAQAAGGGKAVPAAKLGDTSEPDQTLWDKGRIAAYRASLAADAPPLGVLAVPRIGLRAAVFAGTDTLALNRGVGWIEGTAPLGALGNVGLAGHRDGFFRGLKDIAVGDEIEVRSLEGSMRYRVTETLIVTPADVYVLAPTERATLTLVTCYPFYVVGDAPKRFIVKAVADGPAA
ncbi:MAG TPA: class D sortase [Gammaproteobacteria bacterium]|nr:class D sortase [Gammaproteobacteria bacterium]